MPGSGTPGPTTSAAAVALEALRDRGWTLAVAESLTGGLLSARLVDVPGASLVHRGAVVAYATDLKARLLGVDDDLLTQRGPVDPDVALQMADGVRERLGADVGLATTGVAGPEGQDGKPPGTVHVAVVTPFGRRVVSLLLAGDRAAVRAQTVEAALRLLVEAVAPGGRRRASS
ncbi:hypothetical protein CWIS_01430 [Cellulomonas sp. A375-1]|uniref:CinA family protein n=1 Tax=unclassified Cellulomonas TaxID=2620175 RepID=UPI000652780A|nr:MULTISPECIES: CinA family protein [unclassified Cellulomonas]KMM47107.1 hypothetical protein CWIS_01430 [Cellulomonas sp. A375-1]MCR6706062.1 CinA family protein [Cellulomonas sp.]